MRQNSKSKAKKDYLMSHLERLSKQLAIRARKEALLILGLQYIGSKILNT